MSPDHEPLPEHEAELAPLLREALRAHTPPGLSQAQREALEREARAARRARSPRLPTLLALAAALPLALAAGWYTLAREPLAVTAEREAVDPKPQVASTPSVSDAERTAEAARLHALEEARAAAERSAREAAVRAEAARIVEAAAAAAASSPAAAAADTTRTPQRCAASEQVGKKHKSRASKLCPPATGARAASGGCDPNDALCGL